MERTIFITKVRVLWRTIAQNPGTVRLCIAWEVGRNRLRGLRKGCVSVAVECGGQGERQGRITTVQESVCEGGRAGEFG
jgi:hypothetical protein